MRGGGTFSNHVLKNCPALKYGYTLPRNCDNKLMLRNGAATKYGIMPLENGRRSKDGNIPRCGQKKRVSLTLFFVITRNTPDVFFSLFIYPYRIH
jgi:hypothetical protein